MKQFFFHLLKVIGLTIVLALISNFIIGEWFYHIHSRSRFDMRDATYDIVFLGSSRCNHNIDPAIIDSTLHVRSFNLGIEASGPPEMYAVLGVYIKYNKKPRLVACQIDPWQAEENANILARQTFIKYYKKGIIDDFFHSFPDEKYLDIPLYPYIRHRDLGWREWLKYFFKNNEVREEWKYKNGYEPLTDLKFTVKPDNSKCDSIKFQKNKFLLKIIEICRVNDIKLMFFTSPIYKENCEKLFEEFHAYDVPYHNQSRLILDSTCFCDRNHVNFKGALIQTVEMSEYLKERSDLYR